MKLHIDQDPVPPGDVGLGIFAWDHGDTPGDVELVVELDADDLLALGRRLKAHADEWVAEEPDYFEGESMEDVPRPLSDDLFVTAPSLLSDYLRYGSFWHGDAGAALSALMHGDAAHAPRVVFTRFIAVRPCEAGAQLVLGAYRSSRPPPSIFERLMRLPPPKDPDPRDAVRLVREHLRRSARWAVALGCEERWPFFDVAAEVCPELQPPEADVIALEARLRTTNLSARVARSCLWALRWERVKDLPIVTRYELPDPFEPLITLFELGGSFWTEHGYVDVGGGAFRLGRLTDHLEQP